MNVIPFKEVKRNKWPFSFEELIYVIIEQVLTMSRLGGAAAVAPFVIDIPLSSIEDERGESGRSQPAWEKWSNDGTDRHVAKLMEENVGAAMQFLQSKALCIMPISLAKAIYDTQPPDTSSSIVKPETDPTS
ncbi:Transcription factor UNE12 -like protein [Gossypium arboreum]|uniref:Transcription factor UNE12-like protein n=1 Tax=Gossypium arboreum TaxID=29729 RepID=A0A0B0PMZ9_GOSAR|nr:Transcription factor UNE12 -like protein [Gossypium arboreum]